MKEKQRKCESCGKELSPKEIREGKTFCQECEDHWNND